MVIKRNQFLWDFYKCSKGIIPNCLKSVSYEQSEFRNHNILQKDQLPKVCYMSLFPTFLKAELVDDKNYEVKKIKHYGFSGGAMLVSNATNTEDYLKKFTKRQLRVNLKRAMKKLEDAHAVKYEYHFGDISDETCKNLLDALRSMILGRFDGRVEDHVFLMEWDKNTENLAESMRAKKSSLFVVYADDKPISISVNRHINNTILFSETHSFDADYTKYSLGHIDNYMLLHWAIENKYPFIDLGIGVFDYKSKWCNSIYDIEYLIFYKKKSVLAYAITQFEVAKINLKNSVKALKDRIQKNK